MASLEELIADSWFPFAGDITVKPLDPPVVPEPPRAGATTAECRACRRGDDTYIWADEHWRLTGVLPTQLPGIVLLEPRQHADSFLDLPPDLLSGLGPMAARLERALLGLGDVGRVHVNRWGDGTAHFHLWFMPRPLGMLQLRGSMLPMWLDLLPDLPIEDATAALAAIGAAMAENGAAMAENGGTAHPRPGSRLHRSDGN